MTVAYVSATRSPGSIHHSAGLNSARGKSAEAKAVHIQMNEDKRRWGKLPFFGKSGSLIMGWTVGYGYRIPRTGVFLAVWVSMSICRVWILRNLDLFIATQVTNFAALPAPVSSVCDPDVIYPCLSPLPYTLDLLLPIVNFHQADYWAPSGWLIGAIFAMLTIAAWTALTILIAALSGAARHDHETYA